jgi:hypothetical protein
MYAPTGVGDVGCPKCEAASGTPCLYVYNWVNAKKIKAWRRFRTGEPMYHLFHAERHAKFRELRDTVPAQRAALRIWFHLHGDMFEEKQDG